MSFRTRLFIGILVASLLPLAALAFGVRREMERRLTHEYERRVEALARVIESDLAGQSAVIAARLSALAAELERNNRFRLATLQADPGSRRYLLDYAGEAMKLAGLSLLQIQDSSGRILSSGHFRNEFDRVEPALRRALAGSGALALVRTRTPEAPLLALARVDSFEVGGRRFDLVGGTRVEERLLDRLTRDPELSVNLVQPGMEGAAPRSKRVVRELRVPYLDLLSGNPPVLDTANFVITQSLETLRGLQRSVGRWFLLALALTAVAGLGLAAWLSSLISRPLRELANKTSAIDLDRLDQSFDSERSDEVGALSRLLGAMTDRLRSSSSRLREAERRAAVGDLARQINHDIKNGLAPIRNVLRHLGQVAHQQPELLAGVFEERKGTLDSSVDYLETLARNYARLSPAIERRPCQVNELIAQVLRNSQPDGVRIRTELDGRLPPAQGDPLMLRRVLENLIGNAVESLAGTAGGVVTIATEPVGNQAQAEAVRISIADTGPGMTRRELDHAFDDFYTTKPGGTGLGLSIVRRLILDLNGSLRVETAPGAGSRFVIELPVSSQGTGG